ncbi:MAG: hypothetical protein QNJ46_10855 [Leptolyngbyaceae cyanobacterium MO_188.B28]|nr:hypothetical protein [Leptolyngbyaceae cyanobacterium MO_188.B28]
MRLVQTQQLEGNGIPCKSAQKICFEGHSFLRGVTFSNRLRHLANDIYCSEVTAGNACLIEEDETHFTIWYQESSPNSEPISPSGDASTPNQLQHFVQDFVATKRIKPLQSALSEGADRRPTELGSARVTSSNGYRFQWDGIQPPVASLQTSHQSGGYSPSSLPANPEWPQQSPSYGGSSNAAKDRMEPDLAQVWIGLSQLE